MIFQGAMNALNPVLRIDEILTEIIRSHEKVTQSQATRRIRELFDLVGIAQDRMTSYAHELSGGMRQRVVIAMSLLCNPSLIIADEPTTAFDVIVQDQILGALERIQSELGIGMMLITHDMAVIAETCDVVAVMYAGQIVEQATTERIYHHPAHPYTAAMLNSFPRVRGPKRHLVSLRGAPPDLMDPPKRCAFAPRCPLVFERCWEVEPSLESFTTEPQHLARCHLAGSGAIADVWSSESQE
jgi:peptide/nickel transport system ATP-binding protein